MQLKHGAVSGQMSGARAGRYERIVCQFASEGDMNYNIFIAPDFKFIYFTNPICACSTLKWTLQDAVAKARGVPFDVEAMRDIHSRAKGPLQTPRQFGPEAFLEALERPEWTKFTFLRDPYARFLSAHTKKLRRETPFTKAVRAHLGVDDTAPLDGFLSLEAFAKAVADDPALRDLDGHWRLQRRQVLYDFVPDMRVGFVESFKTDAASILTDLFGASGYTIKDVRDIHPQNSMKTVHNPPALSPRAKAHIAAAYAEDFTLINSLKSARVSP